MVMEDFGEWHTIVVEEWFDEDGRHLEYEIEHLPECPREIVADFDPTYGGNEELVDCDMATFMSEFDLGITEPGKYAARTFWVRYPANPNHGDEWDFEVQVVLA